MTTIYAIVGDKNHTLQAAVESRHLDSEWKSYAPSARLEAKDCSYCGFDGDVEVITDLGGERWTCPDCGEPRYSDDIDDYEDPDAERDRWLDDLN